MRRHTAKGVVSSVKLSREDDKELLIEERSQTKERQSKQRKRKAEVKVDSDDPTTNGKKKKT